MKTVFFIVSFLPLSVWAQFSPGELAKAHESLEGIENCTQCHDIGKKVDDNKCLSCHVAIDNRRKAKRGYHISVDVSGKPCSSCHPDHLGKSASLIRWKPSKEKFDHKLAGYVLDGKHAGIKCEDCHKKGLIKETGILKDTKVGASTMLGLSQDCQTCHFDEHRGQITKACATCHQADDWGKSSKKLFDHSKTKYALTGLHQKVECAKCHPTVSDAKTKPDGKTDPDYFKYVGLRFDVCSSCHVDPHQNRLGPKCESCHTTSGWFEVATSGFDHSRTRYPLEGLHRIVACEKCHQPNPRRPAQYKNMAFGLCKDCHADAHVGQMGARKDSCESCHSVKGFRPSLFTVERHRTDTKYPLLPAHDTVSCSSCHLKLEPRTFLERTGFSGADSSVMAFKFRSFACKSCHLDIHRGQFAEKLKTSDCDICHTTQSWKNLVFNHNKDSKFLLEGKHSTTECAKCHPPVAGSDPIRVLYRPIDIACEPCHKDVHAGQFAVNRRTDCAPCHNAVAFKPVIFDHNRQSVFRVDGAHSKVECVKCHPANIPAGDSLIVRYKPVAADCASCHPDIHQGVFEP